MLPKAAHSAIVKEALDASAAVFDAHGPTRWPRPPRSPVTSACWSPRCGGSCEDFAREAMSPGDVYIVNDPYDGGTHLPDVTIVIPVFYERRGGRAERHDGPPPGHRRQVPGQHAARRTRDLRRGHPHPAAGCTRRGAERDVLGDLKLNTRTPGLPPGRPAAPSSRPATSAAPAGGPVRGVRAGDARSGVRRPARLRRAADPAGDREDPGRRVQLRGLPGRRRDGLDRPIQHPRDGHDPGLGLPRRLHRDRRPGQGPDELRPGLDDVRRLLRGAEPGRRRVPNNQGCLPAGGDLRPARARSSTRSRRPRSAAAP